MIQIREAHLCVSASEKPETAGWEQQGRDAAVCQPRPPPSSAPVWPRPLGSSIPERLTQALGPEAPWMRWAEIKGEPHVVHRFPGGQPSPCHATGSPKPRTLGEVGREPALDVLRKTAEWEDLGDCLIVSICLIVPGGGRGSGPGRKGPQTLRQIHGVW